MPPGHQGVSVPAFFTTVREGSREDGPCLSRSTVHGAGLGRADEADFLSFALSVNLAVLRQTVWPQNHWANSSSNNSNFNHYQIVFSLQMAGAIQECLMRSPCRGSVINESDEEP